MVTKETIVASVISITVVTILTKGNEVSMEIGILKGTMVAKVAKVAMLIDVNMVIIVTKAMTVVKVARVTMLTVVPNINIVTMVIKTILETKIAMVNFHGKVFKVLKLYINPLKLNGNYMYRLLQRSLTSHFVFVFLMIFTINSDYFLKQR
jgi:hypothetical protein